MLYFDDILTWIFLNLSTNHDHCATLHYQINVDPRLFFSKHLPHVHTKINCPRLLFATKCSNAHIYLIVHIYLISH